MKIGLTSKEFFKKKKSLTTGVSSKWKDCILIRSRVPKQQAIEQTNGIGTARRHQTRNVNLFFVEIEGKIVQ